MLHRVLRYCQDPRTPNDFGSLDLLLQLEDDSDSPPDFLYIPSFGGPTHAKYSIELEAVHDVHLPQIFLISNEATLWYTLTQIKTLIYVLISRQPWNAKLELLQTMMNKEQNQLK